MRELVVGGIYKHFKGHIYKVLYIGRDVDSLTEKVIYQNIETNEIWVRDKQEFLSLVDNIKYPNVEQKYRFEFVSYEEEFNYGKNIW